MCILFSYISKRIKPGEFKLIILNNRDEYHHRASQTAKFVTDNNIYGMDMTPGKERGTWLGCSRLGKVGVLLNLDSHDHAPDSGEKEGRGFMVPNFLNSKENSFKFVEKLIESANNYNPFNLVFYERNINELWNVSVFDNFNCSFTKVDSEYLSISNHLYHRPYPKTVIGQDMFKEIVEKYNKTSLKNELVDKLLNFAKYDGGKKFEDKMANDEILFREFLRGQVFIDAPNYGTRTHTLILVDDNNNVTYKEKTMDFPIDINKNWLDNEYQFTLNPYQTSNNNLGSNQTIN